MVVNDDSRTSTKRQYDSKSQDELEMSWDCTGGGLYFLNPKTTRAKVESQLQGRLSQLDAMLTMSCGNGFESFSQWSNHVQDNYLWACSMLAKECLELSEISYDEEGRVAPGKHDAVIQLVKDAIAAGKTGREDVNHE